ncbi:unnamed protein product [Albugo candida]|uniref:Uncharacterized protein n=1 Tax=Albugo candida TaxID=65357 RepID=A0A024G3B2_9STRA|nr:unnamed protein product [Albugo candida]|eukprot:CCI41328.1 unnamed protein product [Albugo candida]
MGIERSSDNSAIKWLLFNVDSCVIHASSTHAIDCEIALHVHCKFTSTSYNEDKCEGYAIKAFVPLCCQMPTVLLCSLYALEHIAIHSQFPVKSQSIKNPFKSNILKLDKVFPYNLKCG